MLTAAQATPELEMGLFSHRCRVPLGKQNELKPIHMSMWRTSSPFGVKDVETGSPNSNGGEAVKGYSLYDWVLSYRSFGFEPVPVARTPLSRSKLVWFEKKGEGWVHGSFKDPLLAVITISLLRRRSVNAAAIRIYGMPC